MTEQGELPRRRPRDTRQSILDAAEKLFADKGFDRTPIRDISVLSGAGRSLIYYYFKDKRDLHAALLMDGEAQMQRIAEEAAEAEGTALDKLRRFMLGFSQMHVRRQNLVRVAMRAEFDDSLAHHEQARLGFVKLSAVLTEIIAKGIARKELRPVDLERTVHMVMGLTQSLVVMQLKAMPGSSEQENVNFAMGVLAHGIALQP